MDVIGHNFDLVDESPVHLRTFVEEFLEPLDDRSLEHPATVLRYKDETVEQSMRRVCSSLESLSHIPSIRQRERAIEALRPSLRSGLRGRPYPTA